MKKTMIILGTVALLNVGCAKKIDYQEPIYVTSTKYEKLSCEKIKKEFPNFKNISCNELKEKLIYISLTEYEKLSCSQLHEQFIKMNVRLEAKTMSEAEKMIAVPIFIWLFVIPSAGLAIDWDKFSWSNDPNFNSEIQKKSYETLKEVAIQKNCSFAEDMRDIK